jgi:high-affinity iron transporter
MVFWMRKHARALRAKIESSLGGAASRSRAWSVAIIAALAVGREGAEAVIYVYSLAVERGRSALPLMASEVALGLFAALATAWIASKGIRFLKNGLFFEITGFVLLLSAASLGASAVGRLVQENILPGLIEPAWDMSRWISPSSALMAAFKLIAGYNPRPSLLEVLAYAFYWFLVGASYRFFQFRSLMGKLPFLSALRGANGE